MHTTACQSGDTLTWAKEIDMLGGRICGISWIALLKQFPLFIYLFIYLQNHILESLSRNEKFRAFVFLCIKCTAGKQKKKNNMWFIGILICFKPAKLTEFPRQPLRVKAHQRKKMKKKKKKSFTSREEHSQLRLKLPLGAARRKWVCPRALYLCL